MCVCVCVCVCVYIYIYICRSRDSVVGIAARYGLDGPGIENTVGARFSAPVQTGFEAHPISYTKGTGSFTGVELTTHRHLAQSLMKEYSS